MMRSVFLSPQPNTPKNTKNREGAVARRFEQCCAFGDLFDIMIS